MSCSAERIRLPATLGLVAALLATVTGLGMVANAEMGAREASREVNRALVEELRLTDLALWSEAAYCRHPTQADGFAAWADHPAALERFPAGSLVPPQRLHPIAAEAERGTP